MGWAATGHGGAGGLCGEEGGEGCRGRGENLTHTCSDALGLGRAGLLGGLT